jgi:hypothetical protein
METAKKRDSALVLLCLRIESLETLRANFGPSAVERSSWEAAGLIFYR